MLASRSRLCLFASGRSEGKIRTRERLSRMETFSCPSRHTRERDIPRLHTPYILPSLRCPLYLLYWSIWWILRASPSKIHAPHAVGRKSGIDNSKASQIRKNMATLFGCRSVDRIVVCLKLHKRGKLPFPSLSLSRQISVFLDDRFAASAKLLSSLFGSLDECARLAAIRRVRQSFAERRFCGRHLRMPVCHPAFD